MSKKRSPEEAEAARERCREYEASMAIEGLILEDAERRIIDEAIARGLSGDEAIAFARAELDALERVEAGNREPALDDVV